MSQDLSVIDAPACTPPSEAEFSECVSWFAAAALMEEKQIVRHEPWLAKHRDWDLKAQLLRMIEWDNRARHGWDYETWYLGKHIDDWADPDVRDAVDRCWAGFDVDTTRAALLSSLRLFEQLAERTATALEFSSFGHDRRRQETESIRKDPPRRCRSGTVMNVTKLAVCGHGGK